MAGPGQAGFLVIVFDADFTGMATLPPKRYAVPIVDPNAVLPGPRALQAFQSIAVRDSQVVEPSGCVQGLELALSHAPQISQQSPSVARIPFAKQSQGSLIGERLNHATDELHGTRVF